MWRCEDNQDVGLEAAIIERVRNSSLVEWRCAENITGLNTPPKLWQMSQDVWVGERCTAEKADRKDGWSWYK